MSGHEEPSPACAYPECCALVTRGCSRQGRRPAPARELAVALIPHHTLRGWLGAPGVTIGDDAPPRRMNRVGQKRGKLGMYRGTFPLRLLNAPVSTGLPAAVRTADQIARVCSCPLSHGCANWCRKSSGRLKPPPHIFSTDEQKSFLPVS